MTHVLRSTYTETVFRVRMPVRLTARNDAGSGIVADAFHYRSIGSLQALALAVAASVMTPAMLWLAP